MSVLTDVRLCDFMDYSLPLCRWNFPGKDPLLDLPRPTLRRAPRSTKLGSLRGRQLPASGLFHTWPCMCGSPVSCLFPPPTLVMGVIYSRIWCPWSWSEIDTWAGVQGPEGAGSREQVQGSRSVAASRQCPKPAHEGPWAWVITAPCVRC